MPRKEKKTNKDYFEKLLEILSPDEPDPELLAEIDLSIRHLPGVHTYDETGSWYKGRYDNLVALCVHIAEWQTKRIKE